MSHSSEPLRFAVIGARRGRSFIQGARGCNAALTTLCDANPAALEEWKDRPDLKLCADFAEVLRDPEVDAVCIATPVPVHARQAIAALEAGKHVLSEVTAAYTIEECWDLVEAVERTGLTYMMAENYCFTEAALQVENMVAQGVFGDLVFASGAYIHDCRHLFFHPDGELTWRGEVRRDRGGNTYPTHSLGPVARWLGINRTDFLEATSTWQSRSLATAHYARKNFPARADYARPDNWNGHDTTLSGIRTRNGVLIEIRVDWASARPHNMHRYELQGTKASFCQPDGGNAEPLVWIEGRSPGNDLGIAGAWEPLFKYRDEFEHPLWKAGRAQAEGAGHGGGDYFIFREFVSAVEEGRPPMIDVYDAVTWSSLTPLSQESIARGNAPVGVPNFRGVRPQ